MVYSKLKMEWKQGKWSRQCHHRNAAAREDLREEWKREEERRRGANTFMVTPLF